MAPPAGTLRVGRYFMALLAILAVLYAVVFWPGQRHTPKLGLDLVGGTQVIFTAKTPNGGTPSKAAMNEAKSIMENRVNGTGVTQATVVIQGNNQIVISIPGGTNTDVKALGKAAVLNLRGVVAPPVPVSCGTTAPGGSPAPSGSPSATTGPKASGSAAPKVGATTAAPKDAAQRPLAAPSGSPSAKPAPTAGASGTAKASGMPSTPASAASAQPCLANPLAALKFPIPNAEKCGDKTAPKNCVAYDSLSAANRQALQAALARTDCTRTADQPDNASTYVACDDGRTYGAKVVYLLGPPIVTGRQISSASAQAPNISSGQTQWSVALNLKASGQSAWANYTGAHNLGGTNAQIPSALQCSTASTPCADYVGFVLDGQVISAPANETTINGQTTQITGSFTQTSATKLANQLKYGALPLSFTAQDAQTVSATLGTSQLKAGLLAGGIGLILVVIYSLLYYRALGLVTIASLLVSGALTYACLVILGTQIGFVLSLAGIAGFIVAIGITADSFVVFFERIKDEVHEGRSVRVAIPRAWVRARRTILSADTVSFLAAAVLYYFAAGDVKGFAFTLGLSTILDLIVVFLFTHPMVSLLSRSRAFASARFTGLNAVREGGVAVSGSAPAEERPRQPRRSRAAETPAERADARAAVAVLDDEESADEPAPGEGLTEAERRHTTPQPGTAAERAAARRARMRSEKGQD